MLWCLCCHQHVLARWRLLRPPALRPSVSSKQIKFSSPDNFTLFLKKKKIAACILKIFFLCKKSLKKKSQSLKYMHCCVCSVSTSSPGGDSSDHRPQATSASAKDLYKLLTPQVKCDLADMRESIIIGLGHTNPAAFKYGRHFSVSGHLYTQCTIIYRVLEPNFMLEFVIISNSYLTLSLSSG